MDSVAARGEEGSFNMGAERLCSFRRVSIGAGRAEEREYFLVH